MEREYSLLAPDIREDHLLSCSFDSTSQMFKMIDLENCTEDLIRCTNCSESSLDHFLALPSMPENESESPAQFTKIKPRPRGNMQDPYCQSFGMNGSSPPGDNANLALPYKEPRREGMQWKKMTPEERRSYEEEFNKDIHEIRNQNPQWRYAPAKRSAEELIDPMEKRLLPRQARKIKEDHLLSCSFDSTSQMFKMIDLENCTEDLIRCTNCSESSSDHFLALPSMPENESESPVQFTKIKPRPRGNMQDPYCQSFGMNGSSPPGDNANLALPYKEPRREGMQWKKMTSEERRPYEEEFNKDIHEIRNQNPQWLYAPAKRSAEELKTQWKNGYVLDKHAK